MADFRKWLLAFAVLALIAIPAAAQGNVNPLQCVANGGVPPILRAEGLTEQVGDVVLSCTGGVPTGPGVSIPLVNVQVFLSTPITSRLTSTSGAQWSAAMLIIDEARPNGTQGAGTIYPTQSYCGGVSGCPMFGLGANANPAAANNAYGIQQGNYLGVYSGTPPQGIGTPGQPGYIPPSFNVFQGQQVASNSVAFLGVPFDAPGTMGGVRTMRITNIRTAPGSPSSSLIPQPVVEYISITGATSVPINNPQQIVGYSQFGLDQNATLVNSFQQFTICSGANAVSNNALTGSGAAQLTLNATEGFASAFKVRNYYQVTTNPVSTTNVPQNLPGFIYNTETGFYMGPVGPGGSPVNIANGADTAGLASNGTRLLFTLTNLPSGSTAYVPNYVPLFQKGGTSVVTGFAVLLAPGNVDANGMTGGFGSNGLPSGNLPVATATVSATAGQLASAYGNANAYAAATPGIPASVTPGLVAVPSSGVLVYEIVQTNTSSLETLPVPVFVSYGAFAPGPTTGVTARASVSFAPISPNETQATAAASTTLPIPRFIRTGGPSNAYVFNPCFCNILFPYVTTVQGYETGIAISNTSADPFGTPGSSGTITFNYYGAGAPNLPTGENFTTTTPIGPGGQIGMTVSTGGGFMVPNNGAALTQFTLSSNTTTAPAAAPGFQGYIIAQSRFRYCHGFAFITCIGCGPTSPGASESYLGLILDPPAFTRNTGGNASETLGN